ncbi:hypothetical protein BO82DRAFT_402719 [Aspergillus uvarum CBS 121591]|uniref:SMODS and SLOG-associating 2TM effector domain-containing protein n=1 Tax=Aspergillus uvarum CBS 121591 TaxID=1448315 RepID=A0A319CBH6_9EURO|nr:hypothetical protein BO82DRAFT_402719 [Aspergillus uvarum CBS 121591]PYH81141.1 hypothetical protein BO82DRAFT_402719 [Aspergillus uvarum CBS 121591]
MPDTSLKEPDEERPPHRARIFEAGTTGLLASCARNTTTTAPSTTSSAPAFNVLTIAQMVVGARITALRPSGGAHLLAITVLRAVHTVIAGVLAFLKGRALPQRLRRNIFELRKVLNAIEETQVRLRYSDPEHFTAEEVMALMEEALRRYVAAEEIIENNQPGPQSLRVSLLGKARQGDEERGGGVHHSG